MKKTRQLLVLFLMLSIPAIIGMSQENPTRIEFSANSVEENGISVMGAGFGSYTMPDITFGTIPTDNAFAGATDGRGVIIQADPGEGIMILGQKMISTNAVFMRCAVRTNAPHASVYLASIDQGEYQFISTITPNNGAYFQNRYKWISDFFIPPSSAFQPIIQVVNTSQTERLTVYLDTFEFYTLESGKYYSADFLDGDENDPAVIAMTPVIPTPTPAPTSTPTPTFTPTATPTYTPSPTPTPNTEPEDYGMITFYGVVTSSETGQPIEDAIITISGDSIESQVTLSTENGSYSINIYGYFYDYYDIVVEFPGYNRYQTLSDYDPHFPQTQLNNIVLVRTPGPTPTPTPVPSQVLTVNLTDLPEGSTPLEMVWIPSGRFSMGSPENEIGRSEDETQHTVSITNGFYIGKYEITQAHWQSIMGNNPSDTIGINKPVDKVSWLEAQQFVDRLNTKNIGTFRLPTEAEWEYACRAGSTTRYYWGDDPQYKLIDNYAWYELHDGLSSHEVGVLQPNAWGLHDMLGNVFEWCSDYYAPYPNSLQVNPTGPTTGTEKVRRGGSWLSLKDTCRTATRSQLANYMRSKYIGFRIVRER